MKRVVIVGGGITGLALAHALEKAEEPCRVQLLEVTTTARVSYACDDCGLEGGSCDCGDDSETTYFLGPRGELLLALVPGWVEPGNMAALNSDAAELRDVDASPTRVEGGVLVVNARRLRFVRGALVPAP